MATAQQPGPFQIIRFRDGVNAVLQFKIPLGEASAVATTLYAQCAMKRQVEIVLGDSERVAKCPWYRFLAVTNGDMKERL